MTRLASLHAMWRWRSVIAAGVLIGVAVGWLSAPGEVATTTTFEATHTLILSPQAVGNSAIYRAAPLATLGAVPDRVAARLRIDPRVVRSRVSAKVPIDSARLNLLLVTARSADPTEAEALANVTAEELIVESGGAKSPLRTLEPAVASPVDTARSHGSDSRPGRALLLGAFGLFLGVGAALAVERFDNRIRSKPAAEEA